MVTYVVAQLPFYDKESAEDYRDHIISQAGFEPSIRLVNNTPVVVTVVEAATMEQARAVNRLLQELKWNERTPQVITSSQPQASEVPKAENILITVGITPATREETESEKIYREAYRKTEAFRLSQQRYAQSANGRAAERRYEQSDKGKEARTRYFNSEKGKEARKRYLERRRMKDLAAKAGVELND
jgi:hypothetical protein